jgi:hypothetical protein
MSQPAPEPQPNRPVHKVRIGLIKAAVWANPGRDGVQYNVTFERRFHDGEAWRSTSSFGRDDLLKLAKIADQAHSWITEQLASTAAKPETARPSNPISALRAA